MTSNTQAGGNVEGSNSEEIPGASSTRAWTAASEKLKLPAPDNAPTIIVAIN
ncbi:hypothetical protein HMPREF9997_02803 [Corynebacterium durum F0235]|uniref:Uncharacterized protein n=1 Tax=Corynebacterium durum F0235 TaxID=1035195 RepID=L1M8D6_9CORY|nr:hypothetical protein HMPREF9997_02803 [Corynebacterium durum F0235]